MNVPLPSRPLRLAQVRHLAACGLLASASAAAACAAETAIPTGSPAMTWDFSATHLIAQVPWPVAQAAQTRCSIQRRQDLEMTLPGGATLRLPVGLVSFERSDQVITAIAIQGVKATLAEAHAQARALCAQLGVPVAGIERWFAQASAGERQLGGALDLDRTPALAVRLLYSFDERLPWLVAVDVNWAVVATPTAQPR